VKPRPQRSVLLVARMRTLTKPTKCSPVSPHREQHRPRSNCSQGRIG
jgi:hypothetical protein